MSQFHVRDIAGRLGRVAVTALALIAGVGALVISLAPQRLNADGMPKAAVYAAPEDLAATGLYSDPDSLTVDPAHIAFAPQYPLWTDGAEKRRWISLPPGSAVDASDPDVWEFPVGTRLWKEFAFDGKPVETRYMERLADGTWMFATYAWSEDGRSAELVGERGRMNAYPLGGGAAHAIPGANDCRICHMSAPSPVLGFAARQLASDTAEETAGGKRNSVLAALVAEGVIAGLDPAVVAAAPPGSSALETAALGFLHGNCSHCHNAQGPLAKLGLDLRQTVADPHAAALASTVGVPLKSPPPGLAAGTTLRIAPGQPGLSAIPQRMASRWPVLQMPPLGTALADAEAVDLINRWIAEMETASGPDRPLEGSKK